MPNELYQWITPAIVVIGFLFTGRTIHNVRVELRQDIKDLRGEVKDLRGEVKDLRGEVVDLRDRMGRIEGTLDVLREFFVHNGRGSAA